MQRSLCVEINDACVCTNLTLVRFLMRFEWRANGGRKRARERERC